MHPFTYTYAYFVVKLFIIQIVTDDARKYPLFAPPYENRFVSFRAEPTFRQISSSGTAAVADDMQCGNLARWEGGGKQQYFPFITIHLKHFLSKAFSCFNKSFQLLNE